MTTTRYLAPVSIAEACAALRSENGGARPLAGGTDLLVQTRAGVLNPQLVVDLKRLPLRFIVAEPGKLRIGALATHSDLVRHPALRPELEALRCAARWVGGPALRNRGTVGGNIVNASPAADTVPALIAADAEAIVAGPEERAIPLEQFFTGYRQTVLRPGELLSEVRVPRQPEVSRSVFVKIGNRGAMIIASVCLAASLRVTPGGVVAGASLCYGSVAPTPVRLREVEAMLIGRPLDALDLEGAARAAAESISPISDTRASLEHRVRLVAVHTRRTLAALRDELSEVIAAS